MYKIEYDQLSTPEELIQQAGLCERNAAECESEVRRWFGLARSLRTLADQRRRTSPRPVSPDPADHIGHRCTAIAYVSGGTEFRCVDCNIVLRTPITVEHVDAVPRPGEGHSLSPSAQMVIRGGK